MLAGVFARAEFRDPDLAGSHVTIAEVRVGPDLRQATVFVSLLGGEPIVPLMPALRRVTPYLRRELGAALRLRIVPDLSFRADEAIDHASEIAALLRLPDVARDL